MSGNWAKIDLKETPYSVRPETHWMYETRHGCKRGEPLWFSLQLSPDRAKQLHDAFVKDGSEGEGIFATLIAKGARMAPASHAALGFAVKLAKTRSKNPSGNGIMSPANKTIGADLIVPHAAFGAITKLTSNLGVEISDAGLAIEGDNSYKATDRVQFEVLQPQSSVGQPCTEAIRIRVFDEKEDCTSDPVIIAIIDDGIGIANHRFRKARNETRIAHFLDLAPQSELTINGPQPADELLARSWTGSQIDRLLADYPDDDEQIYRAVGLIGRREGRQPLRAAVSHGTHMLDTAAGYDYDRLEDKPILDKRSIIAVQLPPQVAEDGSDAWKPQSVKRALDWILVKADALSAELSGESGSRLPLIVNCSFGSMTGPQDGQSDVERRISQFVETYRAGGSPELCTVVLSAGNSLQMHAAAHLTIGKKEEKSLPWRVLPDDETPSFVQIWLPEVETYENPPPQVRVALLPPREASTGEFSELDKVTEWRFGDDPDARIYARIYHQRIARSEGKSRECITIAIRPTADDGGGEPVVPAGLWHIKIKASDDLVRAVDVDLHVQRDVAGLFARQKGRQSYFDDSEQQLRRAFTSPTAGTEQTLVSTLTAYGGAEGVLVVAGYRHSDGKPAAYSSSGRAKRLRSEPNIAAVSQKSPAGSLKGHGAEPDIAAVSEESPAFRGILATGTASGSVAIVNGTSVAAALVTRALADTIASGGLVDDLINQAKKFETEHPTQPNEDYDRARRFGAGRLPFKSSYPARTDGGLATVEGAPLEVSKAQAATLATRE